MKNILAEIDFSSKIDVKIMLAELEEPIIEEEKPLLNHSFICAEIAEQLYENKEIKALPELTLDIDKGITPDICIYPHEQIQPNFRRDIPRFSEMPILAIEVISASQNIQDLLIKADTLIANGVKTVWTIEPLHKQFSLPPKTAKKNLQTRKSKAKELK